MNPPSTAQRYRCPFPEHTAPKSRQTAREGLRASAPILPLRKNLKKEIIAVVKLINQEKSWQKVTDGGRAVGHPWLPALRNALLLFL